MDGGKTGHWREPVVCGLLLTVMAPPVAALVFLLAAKLLAVLQGRGETAPLDPLAWLGVSLGAFILGALPAFLAGLFVPWLRRRLGIVGAALGAGALATAAYYASFGAHRIDDLATGAGWAMGALPAFAGVALPAAWLAARWLKPQRMETAT